MSRRTSGAYRGRPGGAETVVNVIKVVRVDGLGVGRGMRLEDGIGMVLPKGLGNRRMDKMMRHIALQPWPFL